MDMQGKRVLITGACGGIGRQTAIALARQGAHVILLCRDPIRAQEALDDVRIEGEAPDTELALVDLSSQQSIRRFAEPFGARYGSLDVLINNAGVYHASRHLSADGIEQTFAINHLGHFLLTRMLMPALLRSEAARIVNVASRASRYVKRIDFDDLQGAKRYFGVKAYAQSKLANIMFTYALARRLPSNRATVNALHPGVIATGIFRELPQPFKFLAAYFLATPEQGARTSIHLASAPDVAGLTGRYFADGKEEQSPPASYDVEAAERLWKLSEEMTGLPAWESPR